MRLQWNFNESTERGKLESKCPQIQKSWSKIFFNFQIPPKLNDKCWLNPMKPLLLGYLGAFDMQELELREHVFVIKQCKF